MPWHTRAVPARPQRARSALPPCCLQRLPPSMQHDVPALPPARAPGWGCCSATGRRPRPPRLPRRTAPAQSPCGSSSAAGSAAGRCRRPRPARPPCCAGECTGRRAGDRARAGGGGGGWGLARGRGGHPQVCNAGSEPEPGSLRGPIGGCLALKTDRASTESWRRAARAATQRGDAADTRWAGDAFIPVALSPEKRWKACADML